MKNLSILLILSLLSFLLTSFLQHSGILEIDPNVKEKAIKYIQPSGYGKTNDRTLAYNNFMQAETYVNDELLSTITKGRMDIFKCYYYWDKDVLIIEGGFTLFSNYGFSARVKKDKVNIVQLVRDDKFVLDNYKIGSDKIRNEVKCSNSKLILEKAPDKSIDAEIYGYLEYEGTDHFAIRDTNTLVKKNIFRDNLKVYFKATKIQG